MNKNILLIAGAVIVVAVVGYIAMGGITGSGVKNPFTMQSTSLKGLLASGQSQKCTFTSSTDNSQSSGEVYVTQGKLRGDFNSVAAGKTVVSHLVVSNDTGYVWIEQPLQGFRMSFATMSGQNGGEGSMDANATTDYKCQAWSVDESKFTLPTNVNFQDVDAMKAAAGAAANTPVGSAAVKANASAGTTGTSGGTSAEAYAAQQCAACNMITDATTKAQCKASFDCR